MTAATALQEAVADLERIVRVHPAYDCEMVQPCVHGSKECGTKPGNSHGRHNAELHMILRGDQAEVILRVGTGWDLPETPPHFRSSFVTDRSLPRGLLVEFHSAAPQYEGHEGRGGQCELWTPCYWDAGYTMSDEPAELLVREGSDAVWEWLEARHREVFGGGPDA